MWNRQRTYTDVIRAYQKSEESTDVDQPRVSHLDTPIISSIARVDARVAEDCGYDLEDCIYTKRGRAQCIYRTDNFMEVDCRTQYCAFEELQGDGFIPGADEDFLTGSLISRMCISTAHKHHAVITGECASLVSGACAVNPYITWYGTTDTDQRVKCLSRVAYDQNDMNCVNSVQIALCEQTQSPISLFISNVSPALPCALYNALLISARIAYDAWNVIRIPSITKWPAHNTIIINFVAFVVTHYATVHILHCAWSVEPKCYILFRDRKRDLPVRELKKYVRDVAAEPHIDLHILTKAYFTDMATMVYQLCVVQKQLADCDWEKTEVNDLWLGKILPQDT